MIFNHGYHRQSSQATHLEKYTSLQTSHDLHSASSPTKISSHIGINHNFTDFLMAKSLKEQLFSAGIASKKQLKTAEIEQRKKAKTLPAKHKKGSTSNDTHIEMAQQEKKAKDRELNELKQQELLKKAKQAEIQQLLEQHQIKVPQDADIRFHFLHNTKIKDIWLTQEQHDQLTAKLITPICFNNHTYLVSIEVYEKILARDPALALSNDQNLKQRIQAEEEEYADFPIPDDLNW